MANFGDGEQGVGKKMVSENDPRERIKALEAELEELRPLAAAAREAYAFLSGRRPGFAPSYAYDVLRSAVEPDKPRKRRKMAARRKGGI